MSLPTEDNALSCYALSNGKVFIISHKVIKNSEGIDYLYTWTKEERRCKSCNKLLDDNSSWFLFDIKFHNEEEIPKLKDGTMSGKALVWSCNKIHMTDVILMTYFGTDVNRVPNLQNLCVIKLFGNNYNPVENEIPADLRERYLHAHSETSKFKERFA